MLTRGAGPDGRTVTTVTTVTMMVISVVSVSVGLFMKKQLLIILKGGISAGSKRSVAYMRGEVAPLVLEVDGGADAVEDLGVT